MILNLKILKIMSLVSEILSTKRKSSAKNSFVHLEAEKAIQVAMKVNVGISSALSNHYVLFSDILGKAESFQHDLDNAVEKIDELLNKVTEVVPCVQGSMSVMQSTATRVRHTREELRISRDLLAAHLRLRAVEEAIEREDIVDAVIKITEVEEILCAVLEGQFKDKVEVVSALRENIVLHRTQLILQAEKAWSSDVRFETVESSHLTNCLYIAAPLNGKSAAHSLWAARELGESQGRMKIFSNNLMKFFVKPILCSGGFVSKHTDSNSHILRVTTDVAPTDAESVIRAIKGIEEMFHFLNNAMKYLAICPKNEVICPEEELLMPILGEQMSEDLVRHLTASLEEAVPVQRHLLKRFDAVGAAAKQLDDYLVSVGFLSSRWHNLLFKFCVDHASMYDTKKCDTTLRRGRQFAVGALTPTAEVGPLTDDKPLVAKDSRGVAVPQAHLDKLSFRSFNLPKCTVSVSICDLVDLLYATLDEARSAGPCELAAHLIRTVRHVLELYIHVVPVAHKTELEQVTQAAALVHNNSMFLAHHVIAMGFQYSARFQSSAKGNEKRQMDDFCGADLALLVRICGCQALVNASRRHKEKLSKFVRQAFDAVHESSTVANPALTCVQECARHWNLLSQAWKHVLPWTVYCKTIGTLCTAVIRDIMSGILSLEDINTTQSASFVGALSLISSSVKNLFILEEKTGNTGIINIVDYVDSWNRMLELEITLGASLRQIEERWTGAGPLAKYFTPSEARGLVRAIFQNTNHRAELLAKMH